METSSLDCVICQDKLKDAYETGCCHQCYCKGCIEEWIRRNGSCPSCRSHLNNHKMMKNIPIQRYFPLKLSDLVRTNADIKTWRLVDDLPIPCTYANSGCKAKITRGTLAAHLEHSCQRSDVMTFARFCVVSNRQFAPPTIDSFCAFVEYMSYHGEKVKKTKRILRSAQALFESALMADPTVGSVSVKMSLKTAKINETYKRAPKIPLTPHFLIQIKTKLNFASSRDRTFWAAIVIGYVTLLRGSNLVPKSLAKFDEDQHLCIQNFALNEGGTYGTFTMKKTKTTQFNNQQSLVIPIVPSSTHLCPIFSLIEMWKLCPLTLQDPMFMYVDTNGQRCPLLRAEFKRMLKEVCAKVGLNSEQISLSSLRQGGMLLATAAGVTKFAGEAQGDCYPGAYHNYIELSMDQRISMARAAASWIKQRWNSPLFDTYSI